MAFPSLSTLNCLAHGLSPDRHEILAAFCWFSVGLSGEERTPHFIYIYLIGAEGSKVIDNINLLQIWISIILSTSSIFDSLLPSPKEVLFLEFWITSNFMLMCYCIRKCFKENFPHSKLKNKLFQIQSSAVNRLYWLTAPGPQDQIYRWFRLVYYFVNTEIYQNNSSIFLTVSSRTITIIFFLLFLTINNNTISIHSFKIYFRQFSLL